MPGIRGPPHDRQTVPAGCAAAAGGAATTGAGGGTGAGATGGGGTAAGTGAAAGGRVPVLVPQTPQNFSSGASGAPQERQLRACGAGGGGTGAGGTAAGSSSTSDAPQFRQNFWVGPTLLPHSGQKGMG